MKAATDLYQDHPRKCGISIHAAREGGDAGNRSAGKEQNIFQSTPPVKAATIRAGVIRAWEAFQSTPPVKAATGRKTQKTRKAKFQSTPPVKAATKPSAKQQT